MYKQRVSSLRVFFLGISICFLFSLLLLVKTKHAFSSGYILLFHEFIQSTDISKLVADKSSIYSFRTSSGASNLGIFLGEAKDSTYGTNQGMRSLPYLLFLTVLQLFSPLWWDRILLVVIIILPFITAFVVTQRLKAGSSPLVALMVGLYYALNPWILLRIGTGFWQLNLAYAFLPFLIGCLLVNANIKRAVRVEMFEIGAIVSVLLLYWFQPHFFIAICLFAWPFILYQISVWKKTVPLSTIFLVFRKWTLLALLTTLLLANWYLASVFFSPESIGVETQFGLDSLAFNSQGSLWQNAILLFPGKIPFEQKKILICYLAFLSPVALTVLLGLLQIKRKVLTSIFCLIFCAVIFFAKGSNPPYQQFSLWFYEHNPALFFFRDPSRLYVIPILLITVGLGYGATQLQKRALAYGTGAFLVTCSIYLFVISSPLSNFFSYVQISQPHKDLYELQKTNLKTLLVPPVFSLEPHGFCVESCITTQQQPFLSLYPISFFFYSGYPDTWESRYQYYLLHQPKQIYTNPRILEKLGIEKMILDTKIQAENVQSVATEKNEKSDSRFLESSFPTAHTSNAEPIFLFGNLADVVALSQHVPASTPIILLNQSDNLAKYENLPSDKKNIFVLRHESYAADAVLSSSLKKHQVDLRKIYQTYQTQWSLFEPYSEPYIEKGLHFVSNQATATQTVGGTFVFSVSPKQKSHLAMRILKSSKGGELVVSQNGNERRIRTVSATDVFTWEIIELPIQAKINVGITNVSGLQVIDGIMVITDLELRSATKRMTNLLQKQPFSPNINSLLANNSDELEAEVLQKVTKQKYYSSGSWLSLPVNYSNYWRLNGVGEAFVANYAQLTFFDPHSSRVKTVTFLPKILQTVSRQITFIGLIWLILLLLRIKKN